MPPQVRRRLFFLLVVIFFATAPLLVFWSQGYRLDREKKTITRVGAIFLKTDPPDVTISLGRSVQKIVSPGILYSGVLVKNLLPRSYEIEIEKSGFWSWKKTLAVEPSLVTKATHIWLLPKELSSSTLFKATSVNSFWLDKNQAVIFYSSAGGRQLWKLSLSEKPSSPTLLLDIAKSYPKETIRTIDFNPSGARILISLTSDALIYQPGEPIPFLLSRPYFDTLLKKQINYGTSTPIVNPVESQRDLYGVKEVFWSPSRGDELLVRTQGALYAIDLPNKKISFVSRNPVVALGAISNDFYFATKEGELFQFVSSEAKPRLIRNLGTSTISIVEGGKFISKIDNSFLVYGKARELFLLYPDDTLQYIANDVRNFKITDDQSKMIFIAGQTLFLMAFRDTIDDIQYQALMPVELGKLPDYGEILNIWWHKDKHHILVAKKYGLTIYETDPRPEVNRMDFELQNVRAAAFDENASTLYYLSGNEIKVMRL